MNALKHDIDSAAMSQQAADYWAGCGRETADEIKAKAESDGIEAAIEMLESFAEVEIGEIVGDGGEPLTILMSRNTLYAVRSDGNRLYAQSKGINLPSREEINAPKPRDIKHAVEIVSQLYSGPDWSLELK